MIIMC